MVQLQFQNSDYYSYNIRELKDDFMKIEFNLKSGTINPDTADKTFLGGQGLVHRFTPQRMSLNNY